MRLLCLLVCMALVSCATTLPTPSVSVRLKDQETCASQGWRACLAEITLKLRWKVNI